MKSIKLFLVSLFVFAGLFLSAQHTVPRFGLLKNEDNTGRVLTYGYATPAYSATYTAIPNYYETVVKMGALTGAQTIKASVKNAWVGDKLTFIFTADTLTAGRVVTASTGFVYVSSTLTVDASAKAIWSFIFDGVAWIETYRAKQ